MDWKGGLWKILLDTLSCSRGHTSVHLSVEHRAELGVYSCQPHDFRGQASMAGWIVTITVFKQRIENTLVFILSIWIKQKGSCQAFQRLEICHIANVGRPGRGVLGRPWGGHRIIDHDIITNTSVLVRLTMNLHSYTVRHSGDNLLTPLRRQRLECIPFPPFTSFTASASPASSRHTKRSFKPNMAVYPRRQSRPMRLVPAVAGLGVSHVCP